MKILLSILSIVFCISSSATSITSYSVGISLSDFEEQGGIAEIEITTTTKVHKINLDRFKNCSPKKVIAKVLLNETTLLELELKSHSGWYKFDVPLDLEHENSLIKVYCQKGIPLRNIWL